MRSDVEDSTLSLDLAVYKEIGYGLVRFLGHQVSHRRSGGEILDTGHFTPREDGT